MRRWIALFLSLLIVCAAFTGCKKNESPNSSGEFVLNDQYFKVESATDDNYRVFYEIFVGSFSDSNGDGIGDLRGIINRMDYLNDGDDNSGKSLGVEGIWLTPIFTSGTYHKYDVNDYYTIDPSFGTEDDLKELIALCHARNVKLILDLPINHTGKLNPWFLSFTAAHRKGLTDDPYYHFYSYYTSGESAPGGKHFAQLSGTDIYYECNFDGAMPELDFDQQEVRAAVLDVAKYYLNLGIDGYRFDAAKYLYYGDNAKCVEFWNWYIQELKKVNPDVYTVAEVWDGDGVTDLYYPALNCFNFTVSQSSGLLASTAQKGDVNQYTKYVDNYLDEIETSSRTDEMYLPFLANHDNDRAAGYLPSLNYLGQMAANLLLLGPGSPFIYYGEELGMRGSRGAAATDANRRLAMVWGDGDTVKDPIGATYSTDNRADAPASEQIKSGTSLYTYYKKLIMIRKAYPEIARGDYTALQLNGTKVGGFISDWNDCRVCVLHNTSGSDAVLQLNEIGLSDFRELRVSVGSGQASLSGSTLTIPAQTSVVLK